MKKNIKRIYLFVVFVLILICAYPLNIYALNKQSSYRNINSTENFEFNNLLFSNIEFKDYSSTSTLSFGLTGIVNNSSNSVLGYSTKVYYYDLNYNLIAESSYVGTAISGTSDYNQMSNLSILNGHSIDEIYYYRLTIDNSTLVSDTSTNNIPSKTNEYDYYDYVIDKYNIDIIVNENNTFDITERITAYFNVPKHGIFRTIPLINTITRLDGTTSQNRAQITNVYVNNEYTTSREFGNYKIQIGSANRTLTGEETYVIKYTYNIGKDPIETYDELYFNIIGSEWDTVLGNVSFTVTMPKDFDSSKLGFSSGIVGSTNNSNIRYNVSGNKITGNYNGILEAGEALTVRCELPEGYFVNAGLSTDVMDYCMFSLPIIFLLISILIWYKFGRDDQVIETVEFYPPEGVNSLDVGFLYNGEAKSKDVISLLIYLANKGYIEITSLNSSKVNVGQNSDNNANQKMIELQEKMSEVIRKSSNSKEKRYYTEMLNICKEEKNEFLIKKLKNYDGKNIHENWFMKELFKFNATAVTDKMLYNRFYVATNKILRNVNNKENKNRIFVKNSFQKTLIILMIIATYFSITIPPMLNYSQIEALFLEFGFLGFVLFFILSVKKSNIFTKVIVWAFCLMFIAFLTKMVFLPALLQDKTYLVWYGIGIICVIGMIICVKYLPKRTKYGTEILGKLKGFKNFLMTAEKEKLESLVMEYPNYFYDILPYTYVLGVSDKWIKKFETISLQAPNWYDSSTSFDVTSFGTFITSTMSVAQDAMSSSPFGSSDGTNGSSGGDSSGGGSSGGGSGGGGGGSW